MTMRPRIGVDLGGSNLRVAAFAGGNQAIAEPTEIHKEAVGEARDPQSIVERVAANVERLAAPFAGDSSAMTPVPVGIGLAAMLRDHRGTVANSPHLRWRDVPFGQLLAARLGPRYALGVYNDVNAITWGEAVAGAARGCRDVLAVYVGTGIGGGVIAGGQLVEGASNCAGEIGHVKVRWDESALPCACGQRGCVEAYVGGSYVAARIQRELAAGASAAVVARAGSLAAVTPSHVDEAAAAGDEWALALWSELAPLLAVALGNALAVLNSERLILGGGLLGRTPALYEQVELALTIVTPAASLESLAVVPAELGDDAGLVGASALAATGVSLITR